MDSSDGLIGGLASGDGAAPAAMKRDQDSTDDFEHLDREGKREEADEAPLLKQDAARHATQSFLDMERDEPVDTARAPSAADKMDHLADKFTDSESDADTAGESPLHLPEPPKAAPSPAPVPEPKPEQKPDTLAESKPLVEQPKPEAKPPAEEPAPEPEQRKPAPTPVQKKQEEASPQPAVQPPPQPARAPAAHVIEAEVIFCQIGLECVHQRVSHESGKCEGWVGSWGWRGCWAPSSGTALGAMTAHQLTGPRAADTDYNDSYTS
ncbi:unnamed protein product [Danaus chrysippus]|uniref:(African queen) hypothetical protein n=1 Tax=Danaus chrysippus TaxID=151541 RepID=A0A8J2R2M9_9NEOP|nr:unnamed protein product [Danaus chrysippus]